MAVTHLAAMAASIVLSMVQNTPEPELSDPLPPPGEVRVHDFRMEIDGRTYAWSVMIPPGAEAGGPGLLFLHGRGESGDDGKRNLTVGLPPAVRRNPDRWPMVLIVPQKPVQNSEWEDHAAAVLAILDEAAEKGFYDPQRLAITGLSQGGHGTIWFAANHSDRFRAAAPVCGYVDRRFDEQNIRIAGPGATPDAPGVLDAAERLSAMPVWLFHGARDDVVPPSESRSLHTALSAVEGASVRYTEYPRANHNSWDAAYAEPDLPAWLVRHTR
ncbi:MAG: prolyl oligopeptidase family serine peptidase [Phycisphaerales bacterium]|nr:prolyl oligopeptidase family serine peptidase [Planctomycetota bacterium]MCH8507443.1 prolyl oligopeptidase family serine peptidase [Phycisphaerales bacterium]